MIAYQHTIPDCTAWPLPAIRLGVRKDPRNGILPIYVFRELPGRQHSVTCRSRACLTRNRPESRRWIVAAESTSLIRSLVHLHDPVDLKSLVLSQTITPVSLTTTRLEVLNLTDSGSSSPQISKTLPCIIAVAMSHDGSVMLPCRKIVAATCKRHFSQLKGLVVAV